MEGEIKKMSRDEDGEVVVVMSSTLDNDDKKKNIGMAGLDWGKVEGGWSSSFTIPMDRMNVRNDATV